MSGFYAAVLSAGLGAAAAASPTGPGVSYVLPPAGKGVLIRLQNGQELSGVLLRREDGAAWIGVDQGEVGVNLDEIASAEARGNAESEFRARERALKPADAAGWWELSLWANARGLDASARAAARRAVAAAPDHAQARAFLGEEKVGGRWLAHDEAMAARGFVADGGEWITKTELAARRLAAQAEERRRSDAALRESVALLLRLEAARQSRPRQPEPVTYIVSGVLRRHARPFPDLPRIPGADAPATPLWQGPFAPLFGPNFFARRLPLDR